MTDYEIELSIERFAEVFVKAQRKAEENIKDDMGRELEQNVIDFLK
jgi:hypothetical protein